MQYTASAEFFANPFALDDLIGDVQWRRSQVRQAGEDAVDR
jgi:hypothetical protein